MKIRCERCNKVIRVVTVDVSSKCPECSYLLAGSAQPLSPLAASASQLTKTSKGELPTVNKSARNAGFLIVGVLLFGVPMLIVAVTEGDNAAYWILAIGALIALIPLGVWFERNTIRRK